MDYFFPSKSLSQSCGQKVIQIKRDSRVAHGIVEGKRTTTSEKQLTELDKMLLIQVKNINRGVVGSQVAMISGTKREKKSLQSRHSDTMADYFGFPVGAEKQPADTGLWSGKGSRSLHRHSEAIIGCSGC